MNIYKIKCISLKRREDRRVKMAKMFGKHDFEFVDALDGKEYKLTKFDTFATCCERKAWNSKTQCQ